MEDKTPLGGEELRHLPEGWEYRGNALHKTWKFEKFMKMPDFVLKAVSLMNEVNHHADISMDTKNKIVSVSVTTHSAGCVTRADMEFARMLDIL